SRIFLVPAPIADVHSKAAAPMVQVAAAGSPTLMPTSSGAEVAEGGARIAYAAPRRSSGLDPVPARPGDELFVIDMSQPRSQRYLEIPTRPGDVVLIPLAGEVTVQGWVQKG